MTNGHLTDAAITFRSINSQAAGVTVVNGTGFDLSAGGGPQGFDAVRGVGLLGALTATQTTALKLQQSNDNGALDPWTDIANSQTPNMADGDSNKLLLTDVIRPTKKWVRAVVVRGVANAAIDGVILELYRARRVPVVQDGTVSQTTKILGGN
jgi:hypothetical protein